MSKRLPLALAMLALAPGTAVLARPATDTPAIQEVPPSWPQGEAYAPPTAAGEAPAYTYRQVLSDPRLVTLIDMALAHNPDVEAALANIAAARAQYRIQDAQRLPQLDASGSYTRAGGPGTLAGTTAKGDSFAAEGSVPAYEVDLFGRLSALSRSARQKYLATVAAERATRLTLVADVANAWLAYAADTSLLRLARDTAESARASVVLTAKRVKGGIAPLSDQRKAELTLHQAEADVSAQITAQAQNLNALRQLVGADIPAGTLPADIADASTRLAEVPAGLSSAVLLRRPDVLETEHSLSAAKASTQAARAALFPKITLTGLAGVASQALANLFTGGAFSWAAGGGITWPIFNGGASRNGLKLATAQQQAALAAYRKAIEAAFADTADVLARRGTIEGQLAATQAARDAAADNYTLTDERYRGGVSSYLDSLSAQQTLYASEKSLIATRLTRASNLVGLYRALGGDGFEGDKNGK